VAGVVVAFLLSLVFRLGVKRSVQTRIVADGTQPRAIEDFLNERGAAWGARQDVVRRATFGVTQLVESVVEHCEPRSDLVMAVSLRGPLEPFAEELRRFAAARLELIDNAFEAAAAYGRARGADPAHPTDLRWEALQPVLRGERPLFVQADELAQIRHALVLAERHGFRLVIVGGADAWCIAGVVRERQVSVIIASVHRLPLRRVDEHDAPYRLAALLPRCRGAAVYLPAPWWPGRQPRFAQPPGDGVHARRRLTTSSS